MGLKPKTTQSSIDKQRDELAIMWEIKICNYLKLSKNPSEALLTIKEAYRWNVAHDF